MFNKTFWKNSLKFGAIAGIACLGYSVVLDLIGITPISGKLFPSNIFILIASILAVKSYRRNNPDETLHFWEGLSLCFVVALSASIIVGGGLYLFYSTEHGQELLAKFVVEAVKEYTTARQQIIKETNLEYFNNLIAGIKAIDPVSIAFTELKQRPLIAILPSIMISLYYRRQYVK